MIGNPGKELWQDMNDVWEDNDAYFLIHPDENVAVFYLPLPEALPIPDQASFANYLPLDRDALQLMRESDLDFSAAPASGNVSSEAHDIDLDEIRQLYRFGTLSSSLMFHNVETDLFMRPAFDAASLAMDATLSYASPGERPSLSTLDMDRPNLNGIRKSEPSELSLGSVMVVEAVVPLRLIDADAIDFPDDPIDISTPLVAGRDTPYQNATEQNFASRLNMALSTAIDDVRNYQRGYYAATGDAITLLTRERLPILIPFYVRTMKSEQGSCPESMRHLAVVKPYDRSLISPAVLDDEQLAKIADAVGHVTDDNAFVKNLDTYREAKLALKRDGDTRIAAILIGVAAETLLDEVLLSLMWEEGKRPEDVAGNWEPRLMMRIKGEFPSRLGGRWDLKAASPVTNWETDIVRLRNRVAHSTDTPSHQTATLALSRMDELIRFLVDQLLQKKRLARYPRTAWMLAGEQGFQTRGVVATEIERLQNDPTEPIWYETFARWRDTFLRCRRATQIPREGSGDMSILGVVAFPDGTLKWCQHDPQQRLARAVETDVDALPIAQQSSVNEILRKVRHVPEPVAISLESNSEIPFTIAGDWREDYRFFPIFNPMVGGPDLDGWDFDVAIRKPDED